MSDIKPEATPRTELPTQPNAPPVEDAQPVSRFDAVRLGNEMAAVALGVLRSQGRSLELPRGLTLAEIRDLDKGAATLGEAYQYQKGARRQIMAWLGEHALKDSDTETARNVSIFLREEVGGVRARRKAARLQRQLAAS